jgi:hypothetical protein
MVLGFQRIASRFRWLKLQGYRPLKKLAQAFAGKIAFARLGEKVAKFLQCPFLVALAIASDMADRGLHTFRLCQMPQVHTCQIVHKAVIAWIRFGGTSEEED